MKTEYVLGLMFDDCRERVVLVQKARPEWQAGQLNGAGGKVEPGESPEQAMVREFSEEAGVETSPERWRRFARLHGEHFDVIVFYMASDEAVSQVRTMTDEAIVVSPVDLNALRETGVSNLPWLVGCALDADLHRFQLDVRYQ
ncbi:NUDIX hydrolase [Ralstonia pseudosolanacearum]|uniref:NUDIX hydrolase n=1 Tax=Ralstonia pseudosolanacearum TaxID=1310165 RepID=UPI003CEF6515